MTSRAASPNSQSLQLKRVRRLAPARRIGKVVAASGTTIRVSGLAVSVGQACRLYRPGDDWELGAEVIGVSDGEAVLQAFGHLRGLGSDARVEALRSTATVAVGPALLGRIVDATGAVLDGNAPPALEHAAPVMRAPPPALAREPLATPIETGVGVIDSLLTCARGQRLGLFAPAGAGKSTLLGMLAEHSVADVIVVALIGERGREVREFVDERLAAARARSVVVVSTSDEPSLLRARSAYTATAIAEYFRDQGLNVLLIVDSLTRYARALRDIGLASGEPVSRSGYPPSVYSELPQLLERSGCAERGTITAFYSMLVENDEELDPIAEEAVSILDGHIVLSRELAMQGHYPPVDVLGSVSRAMNRIVTSDHVAAAMRARALIAKYRSLELLMQMGEYEPGHDEEADAAVRAMPLLKPVLEQRWDEKRNFAGSVSALREAVAQ